MPPLTRSRLRQADAARGAKASGTYSIKCGSKFFSLAELPRDVLLHICRFVINHDTLQGLKANWHRLHAFCGRNSIRQILYALTRGQILWSRMRQGWRALGTPCCIQSYVFRKEAEISEIKLKHAQHLKQKAECWHGAALKRFNQAEAEGLEYCFRSVIFDELLKASESLKEMLQCVSQLQAEQLRLVRRHTLHLREMTQANERFVAQHCQKRPRSEDDEPCPDKACVRPRLEREIKPGGGTPSELAIPGGVGATALSGGAPGHRATEMQR